MHLDPLAFTLRGREFDGGEPPVFFLFTVLAAFRRIFQVFVAKKALLAGGPNKCLTAIDTKYTDIF